MGVNFSTARILLHAKSMGVSFDRTLTLGRQNLFVTARDLVPLFGEIGERLELKETEELKRKGGGYCESFFERLGAKQVDSIDATDYEGATIIHDMNAPFPDTIKTYYDAIYDGGTLEHIFDFPTAIRNCMEALNKGGHFIGSMPVNNLMGHGFYQFSPELLYRIFSAENGFSVRCMYITENVSPYQYYAVTDPKLVGDRVLLTNFRETYLLVVAKREEIRPIFASSPQQSDYSNSWVTGSSCNSGLADLEFRPSLGRRLLPDRAKSFLRPLIMLLRDSRLLIPSKRMPLNHYRKVNHRQGPIKDWL